MSTVAIMPAESFPKSGALDAVAGAFATAAVRNIEEYSSFNKLTLLGNAQEGYPEMLHAIACAKHAIALEMYIFRSDDVGRAFVDALAKKAREGVYVRVLYDAIGSLGIDSSMIRALESAGASVIAYRPWLTVTGFLQPFQRDHRKLLAVDDRVAFVSGFNIGNEYLPVDKGGGGWFDIGVAIEGPAALELAKEFDIGWNRANSDAVKDELLARTQSLPTFESEGRVRVISNIEQGKRREIRKTFLSAIRKAQKTITLVQAYFVPDAGILLALSHAAKRGVRVRILLPSRYDVPLVRLATRAMFSPLLRHGVQVFEWKGPMMHAKAAVIDGMWTALGSYNMDYLSLIYNWEVVVVCIDRDLADQTDRACDAAFRHAREINWLRWTKRPTYHKWMERLTYKLRRWM